MSVVQYTEFAVLPPENLASEIVEAKDRFNAHLNAAFPGYSFEVLDPRKIEDFEFPDTERFMVIGKVRVGNTDKPFQMPAQPDPQFIQDVMEACDAFLTISITRH